MLTLKNERETLLAVAEKLEKGELIHVDVHGYDVETGKEIGTDLGFNMELACDCGSAACIGGWAYLHENPGAMHDASKYVYAQEGWANDEFGTTKYIPLTPLAPLYFPRGIDTDKWSSITREQAATAIRRYLAGEERIWDHVSE